MSKLDIKDFPDIYAYSKACYLEIKEALINRQIVNVEDFTNKLDEMHMQILYQNLTMICLTDGCPGNCKFCSENPKPRIDKQFAFSGVEKLIKDYYASDIPDWQKERLAPYFDSDLLDYAEVDKEGNIIRDFRDVLEVLKISGKPDRYLTMTRLPSWCITSFLEYATEFIKTGMTAIRAGQKPEEENFRLSISINKNNKEVNEKVLQELVRIFSQFIPKDVKKLEELTRKQFTSEIDGFFADDFLSHLGRNYKESVPFEFTSVACRCTEGFKITPNGIYSMVNIFPDKNNPNGLLYLPFANNAPYFKRAGLDTLHEVMNRHSKNNLLPLPLEKSLVGQSDILTHDNIIKREAFRFKHLDNLFYYNGIALLMLAYYEAPDGQEAFIQNIEESRRILKDTASSNLVLDDLKTKVLELLDIIEGFISYLEHKDLPGLTNEYFRYLCSIYDEEEAIKKIDNGQLDFYNVKDDDTNPLWDSIKHKNIYGTYLENQKAQIKVLKRMGLK